MKKFLRKYYFWVSLVIGGLVALIGFMLLGVAFGILGGLDPSGKLASGVLVMIIGLSICFLGWDITDDAWYFLGMKKKWKEDIEHRFNPDFVKQVIEEDC